MTDVCPVNPFPILPPSTCPAPIGTGNQFRTAVAQPVSYVSQQVLEAVKPKPITREIIRQAIDNTGVAEDASTASILTNYFMDQHGLGDSGYKMDLGPMKQWVESRVNREIKKLTTPESLKTVTLHEKKEQATKTPTENKRRQLQKACTKLAKLEREADGTLSADGPAHACFDGTVSDPEAFNDYMFSKDGFKRVLDQHGKGRDFGDQVILRASKLPKYIATMEKEGAPQAVVDVFKRFHQIHKECPVAADQNRALVITPQSPGQDAEQLRPHTHPDVFAGETWFLSVTPEPSLVTTIWEAGTRMLRTFSVSGDFSPHHEMAGKSTTLPANKVCKFDTGNVPHTGHKGGTAKRTLFALAPADKSVFSMMFN